MKNSLKLFYILFVISPLFFVSACEEDFSPKGEYESKYVINCIMEIDNYYWVNIKAVVSRNYDIDGIIPSDIENNEFIPGIKMTVFSSKSTVDLSDSTIVYKYKNFPVRYIDSVYWPGYYVNNDPVRVSYNEEVLLEARMPDGSKLTSSALIPYISFEMQTPYTHGITTNFMTADGKRELSFNWAETYVPDYIYFPKLEIKGRVISTQKSISIIVPCKYVQQGNKAFPVFPNDLKASAVSYDFAAIDSAMKNISKGYNNKDDILITSCSLSLITYDRSLSDYYASINGYMDKFSIRTDQNIFSNIKGGYGIFGAYIIVARQYDMAKEYVKSFGYQSAFEHL